MKKVTQKIQAWILVALTVIGTFMTPMTGAAEQVHAANGTIDSELYQVIKDVTGQDFSSGSSWQAWANANVGKKIAGSPSYGLGIGNDVRTVTTGAYTGQSMDCVRSSIFLVGHALQKAGEDPTTYFSQIGYNFNGYGKFEDVGTDISKAKPGALLQFGNQHLGVALGWYNGSLWQIDASNTYNGWFIQKYKGYAGSGTTVANLTHIYNVPPLSKTISYSVNKKSLYPDCTNNNSLYNLSGAKFGVYTQSNTAESSRIDTLTTDRNGNASGSHEVDASVNTVYIKELSGPINYNVTDKTVHTVNVSNGSGSTSFSDSPINDPAAIVITKVDKEGKTYAAPMGEAQFTLNYYDTLGDVSGRKPFRTWVIKSAWSQTANKYDATLDDAHRVSGNIIKNSKGQPIIPLGTLTITETTPPTGYTTEGGFIKTNGEQVSATETMTFKIVNENSAAVMMTGNVATDPSITKDEVPVRGGYSVQKQDYKTGTTPEGDAAYAGAEFDLYYLGNGDGKSSIKLDKDGDGLGEGTEYQPSTTTPVDHIVLDANGHYQTPNNTYLGYGNYRLVETKAPTGYLASTYDGASITVDFSTADNKVVLPLNAVEYPMLGSFTVRKNDNDIKQPYAQGDTNLKTTFRIYNRSTHPVNVNGTTYGVGAVIDITGDGSGTFTTDDSGFYAAPEKILPYGTYQIEEVAPPTGYTSTGTTNYTFSIRRHGQIEDATYKIFNKPVRGGFSLQKNDKDYGTRSQGDTNLSASFELVNRSADDVWVDVNGDGVYSDAERFAPNAVITTFETDKNGYYTTPNQYLPYGTYQINEMIPPTGYTKDGVLTKTFTIRTETKVEALTNDINNRVDYGKFSIYKVAANNESDWTKPEKDVEFTAILASKIGAGKTFATWDDAYKAIKAAGEGNDVKGADGSFLMTKHEYAVVHTDAQGKATSGDLAYGTYTIRQTSHVTETVDVKNGATFVVSRDGQETVPYTATNTPMQYYIHMVKKDVDTGKTVSLNSAQFKIYQLTDGEGKKVNAYVKQKVGLKTYDTFQTNSDNNGLVVVNKIASLFNGDYLNTDDDKGGTTTPLKIKAGTYRIEEVKTPEGYLKLEKPVEFTVKESNISRIDDDGDPIINVEVRNNKPHGTLIVDKKLENFESDQSLLRSEAHPFDYSKIKFGVYAAKDIIDPADGSVLVKSGKVAKNVYGKEVGEFNLNKDGSATIKDLPMGEYVLKEIEVPEGIVLDKTAYNFKLTQEDQEAAHKQYVVTFKDGTKVTDWENEQKVQTANKSIINTVTKTSVSKKKVTGDDELEGATLTIKNPDGSVVKDIDGKELTWVSGKKPHVIEGLHLNTEYVLEETIAVDGYVKATSIPFLVNVDGSVTKVTMIDKYVSVSKKDVAGDEIKGAEMSVTDENGKVVDSWKSDGTEHKVNGLEEGKKYTIHEVVAPNGYVKVTDIPFTAEGANKDGKKTNQHIDVVDKRVTMPKLDSCGTKVKGAQITIYEADENGNAVVPDDGTYVDQFETSKDSDYVINNLVEGKTYVAVETIVPEGYVKFKDYKFVAEGADKDGKKKDQIETLVDKQVTVSKEDLGGTEIEGAKLTVTDKETGKIVDSWTSSKEEHNVNNLEVGKTYVLTEDTAPLGYVKSTTVEFTTNDDGVDQRVTMIDTTDELAKVDDEGNYIKGASLEAVDADGNVVDTWTSGQHIIDLTDEAVKEMKKGTSSYTYTTEDGKEITVYTISKTKKTNTKAVEDSKDNKDQHEEYCKVKKADSKEEEKPTTIDKDDIDHYEVKIKDAEGNVSYYNIDTNGDETSHRINNLDAAKGSYTVRETKTVDGYYYDKDAVVTADGENHAYTMTDNKIRYSIAKVDDEGKYVKGVTLKLTDVTDDENHQEIELPNEGVTTDKPFELDGVLKADHKYELVESEYVAGVYKATSLTFTVPHYGTADVTTITMEDTLTNVSVSKVDNHGKAVKGAKMSILEAVKNDDGNITPALNEDGTEKKPVYTFTSEDKPTDVSDYVKGSNELSGDVWYILREDEAPFGFEKTKDIPFTVTGTNETHQVIMATDVRKTYYVSAVKVDKQNEKKLLKGAELTLFTKDGKVAKDVNGKEAKGLTDGKGNITWNVEYNGDGTDYTGYYVMETAAPKGYKINPDKHNVTLSEDYKFANDNAVKIVVRDTLLPAVKTNVSANIIIPAMIFVGALIGIAVYFIKKRRGQATE